MNQKLKIGVLVSGNGTNLQSIISATQTGSIPAEIVVVISNKETAFALERARSAQIPTKIITNSDENEITLALKNYQVELVVLAGFMKILSPKFIHEFKQRIINIHPSLLPAFPGLHAQQQALDYGAKITGCTVHFVDEGCDTGPIILQASVPILDDDDGTKLSQRILAEEHIILPKAIDLLARNKVAVLGRRTAVKGCSS